MYRTLALVVAKGVVLLRIQKLEQRGARTAMCTCAAELSISSSTKTGSRIPTRRMSRTTCPGWEAVRSGRGCARGSLPRPAFPHTSSEPARSCPSASATPWARDVLPTPGGPARQRTGPREREVTSRALPLQDGHIVEDPFLHGVEPIVPLVPTLSVDALETGRGRSPSDVVETAAPRQTDKQAKVLHAPRVRAVRWDLASAAPPPERPPHAPLRASDRSESSPPSRGGLRFPLLAPRERGSPRKSLYGLRGRFAGDRRPRSPATAPQPLRRSPQYVGSVRERRPPPCTSGLWSAPRSTVEDARPYSAEGRARSTAAGRMCCIAISIFSSIFVAR